MWRTPLEPENRTNIFKMHMFILHGIASAECEELISTEIFHSIATTLYKCVIKLVHCCFVYHEVYMK